MKWRHAPRDQKRNGFVINNNLSSYSYLLVNTLLFVRAQCVSLTDSEQTIRGEDIFHEGTGLGHCRSAPSLFKTRELKFITPRDDDTKFILFGSWPKLSW
jgi:hypothetical protein